MSPQRKKITAEISLLAKQIAANVQDADTTIKIPNSDWTVGDMTAHLIISQQIISSVLTGKKNQHVAATKDFIEEANHNLSREYIAGLNKNFLSHFSQRDGSMLAELLLKETESSLKDMHKFSDTHMVNTHFGRFNLIMLLRYCLTHYLIHSSTIAKTLKQQLPITNENTSLIIPFIKIAMVRLYDKKAAKNFNGNFVFAIKEVQTFSLFCKPNGVTVSDSLPLSLDCSLSMDALTFFLVSNGYLSQWRALMFGTISLGGKKPWLALKLSTLFRGL